MSRKHVCIYGKKCFCGAGETRVLHDRVVVAGVGGCAGWPMKSEALAVSPKDAAEECENYRKAGLPTEITKDGRPVLTSRAHYLAALKLNKMHERSKVLSGRPCA